MFLTRNFFFLD